MLSMRSVVHNRCGVRGSPIEHSLSPVLHRAAYRALGLGDWSYDRIRVEADELATHVAAVVVPFDEPVMR